MSTSVIADPENPDFTILDEDDEEKDPTLNFLNAVERQVFLRFVNNYVTRKQFKTDDVIAMSHIFGEVIEHALELVDEDLVMIRQNERGNRTILQVVGVTASESYWIPPGHALCQCMHFTGKSSSLFCKHILAAHFYLAVTPTEKYIQICDQELDEIVKTYFQEED